MLSSVCLDCIYDIVSSTKRCCILFILSINLWSSQALIVGSQPLLVVHFCLLYPLHSSCMCHDTLWRKAHIVVLQYNSVVKFAHCLVLPENIVFLIHVSLHIYLEGYHVLHFPCHLCHFHYKVYYHVEMVSHFGEPQCLAYWILNPLRWQVHLIVIFSLNNSFSFSWNIHIFIQLYMAW